jgi:hypothetical protein
MARRNPQAGAIIGPPLECEIQFSRIPGDWLLGYPFLGEDITSRLLERIKMRVPRTPNIMIPVMVEVGNLVGL